MYHSMGGWSWVWMSVGVVVWVLVIGCVAYAAVRLAQQHGR